MTEADWLTGTDFDGIVRYAAEHLSPRRQRLLAAGFCHAVGPLLDRTQLSDALDAIERYSDGFGSSADLEKARQRCREVAQEEYETYRAAVDRGAPDNGLGAYVRSELAWAVAFAATSPLPVEEVGARAAAAAARFRTKAVPMLATIEEAELGAAATEQAIVMRGVVWDVVGNPFRPVAFAPAWRTDTAIALARHIYDRREFSAMPILADALQDAGCDSDAVLNHCREPGTHFRGCWVLDGVLGRG